MQVNCKPAAFKNNQYYTNSKEEQTCFIFTPMSHLFPHDHIKPIKNSEINKKEQVKEMFNSISGRYDWMNRFLSARTDMRWRKKAVTTLLKNNPKKILDIATGTADMAILACKMLKPEQITGIDISEGMLEMGRKKIEKEQLTNKIQLQIGDSETISFANNTFDAVMAAFGVRNFENLEKGLSEMYRVLKPGGHLLILEFSKPQGKFIKKVYNLYMNMMAPKLARLFKQNKEAYQYLNESANAFPDCQLFTNILKDIGYTDTQEENHLYKNTTLPVWFFNHT
jgi:demethylmenaquinone methyltransferase/2-methoxy-6-polyprenyl-1,4-benzoquinol methylase